MAYRTNPFLERMSERTTSDQEFVRLFSPKILERLSDDTFEGAVHIFRSPPGGGKTTLLRALTPAALRAFWNARRSTEMNEAYQRLIGRGVLDEAEGPKLLGVLLSCASGYADLPPGASATQEGLFRALLDCRVVLRSLRSLALLLGFETPDQLDSLVLEYDEIAKDFKHIPVSASARELVAWAEREERSVYSQLDSLQGTPIAEFPGHVRFEGVLWLQAVRFFRDGRQVAPKRLLMIDDLHKLRKKQRTLLIGELSELRPAIPIWLAERSIALGEELLSQGVRQGRDIRHYPLEEMWGTGSQHQFNTFAQNILDRRLFLQNDVPKVSFSQYLRSTFNSDECKSEVHRGMQALRTQLDGYTDKTRYSAWLEEANKYFADESVDAIRELYATKILITRDESKSQLALELGPLSADELDDRDNSQVQAAAEIFIHNEHGIPHYFGVEKLCTLATSNVEELLSLAAGLFEGLQAKQVLGKPLYLSPAEQEKLLKKAAKSRRDFIPKNHTEGTRAQRLLDSIGGYCRERTFLPNAPYAPGVTGIRLDFRELARLKPSDGKILEPYGVLARVLGECVAENLLVTRPSAPSASREGGTIFYLNRTLCAHYSLPLQMGGWQDVAAEALVEWMTSGRKPDRQQRLG